MLDSNLFQSEFLEVIAPHFGIDTASERMMFRYYQAWQAIPDERFIQVMDAAFVECDRRTFSVPWVIARAKELAFHLSMAEELPALPSELDKMTDEQREENIKRLRAMMKDSNSLRSAAPSQLEDKRQC
jgi:hypothetical protein